MKTIIVAVVEVEVNDPKEATTLTVPKGATLHWLQAYRTESLDLPTLYGCLNSFLSEAFLPDVDGKGPETP